MYLLILDVLGSHSSIEFLPNAAEQNILGISLPYNSSHIFQALDMCLFATMSRNYGPEVDKLTSHGITSVKRGAF